MTAEPPDLDDVDRRILGVLTRSGRISWRELGEAVGLSANATADRVRRLERCGVIVGYRAEVDLDQVGRPIEAAVEVRRRDDVPAPELEAAFRSRPEVLDAVHLTGGWDYLLRVRVADPAGLDRVVTELKAALGATQTETRVVLRRVDGFPREPLPDDPG